MSGLRISYQKSEFFVLGVGKEEEECVATLFNCETGFFPMKYLGVPVFLTKSCWHPTSIPGQIKFRRC
jgi:hypothetical protein